MYTKEPDPSHEDSCGGVCVCCTRCFWDVVLAFPLELQKKLLHFATGSDRVPVGGMADLNFKIAKIEVSTDWWVSHADRTETRTESVH